MVTPEGRSRSGLVVNVVIGLAGLLIACLGLIPAWGGFLRVVRDDAGRLPGDGPVSTTTGSRPAPSGGVAGTDGKPAEWRGFVVGGPRVTGFTMSTQLDLDTNPPEARVDSNARDGADLTYWHLHPDGLHRSGARYLGTSTGSRPATAEECRQQARTRALSYVPLKDLKPGLGLCLETDRGNVAWLRLDRVRPGVDGAHPTLTVTIDLWRP
ncbi:hypothetical protein ACIBP4_26820 [Micromonospora maritima]|uniref:Uncharacterized protein n=1 Tax=Micromonospora maritima TaxID=986711 RepID=A0ABW7ZTK5_9ACTN